MDKDCVLDLILSGRIEFTEHINEIEIRKGRQSSDFVKNYIINNSDKLYKIDDARYDRFMLRFYMSRKYDLVLIAAVEDKVLKIITYYKYLKKGVKI